MPSTWITVGCLALAVLTGGCGGHDAEDLANELADVYGDMADVIEGFSDSQSIEDARPRMRKIAERIKALRDDWEAAGADVEAGPAWDATTAPELMEAQQRMTAAMMKIGMNPALSAKFAEVMREFEDVFQPPR